MSSGQALGSTEVPVEGGAITHAMHRIESRPVVVQPLAILSTELSRLLHALAEAGRQLDTLWDRYVKFASLSLHLMIAVLWDMMVVF
jgi:hypothetical protein